MSRINELVKALLLIEEIILNEQTRVAKSGEKSVQSELNVVKNTFTRLLETELYNSKARTVVIDIGQLKDNTLNLEEWKYYFKDLDMEFIDNSKFFVNEE